FAAAALIRRDGVEDVGGPLAAAAVTLFVLPVAVHGFAHWTRPTPPSGQVLTLALVRALRDEVPRGAVVVSDPETSYRIAAEAPVYIVASPPTHVADTRRNHPRRRVREVRGYLSGRDPGFPLRVGARWILVDRRRSSLRPHGRLVYDDARYLLYRL